MVIVERVGLWGSAVGGCIAGLAPVSDGDVGLRVGEPVHELPGQTQDLPLGLGELGEGQGEPGVSLGHVGDEDGMPCGGEFEHLVTPVGLVQKSRDEPVSLQLREHPRERLRPLMCGGGQRTCGGRAVPIYVAEHAQLVEAQTFCCSLGPKALGEPERALSDTSGGLSESLELHPLHYSTLFLTILDSEWVLPEQVYGCYRSMANHTPTRTLQVRPG